MEGSNRRHVGIDLAKRTMEVCFLGEDGKASRWSVKTDGEGRKRLARRLRSEDVVGIEACMFAFSLQRYLKDTVGCEVIVLNAGRLAIIHQSTNKTDKLDAYRIGLMISRFDRSELPEVSVPTEQEEEMRTYVSAKQYFTDCRTRTLNRLHALYIQAGITDVEPKNLKKRENRALCCGKLIGFFKDTAEALERDIESNESNIEAFDLKLRQIVSRHELAPYLLSVPGVGPNIVTAFLAFVGNGNRFASAAQVANYAGLVPRVDCSGETERRGGITKNGNPLLRRLMLQAAWSMARSRDEGWLKIKLAYFVERKGKMRSIVAMARKILELLWILAQRRQYYAGCSEARLAAKLKRYGVVNLERAA